MTQIVLTSEQAAKLSQAVEPVSICWPDGRVAGFASPSICIATPEVFPFSAEEIAAAEKEAAGPGPFRTTREILERLERMPRE
jgi:hypothetical protein